MSALAQTPWQAVSNKFVVAQGQKELSEQLELSKNAEG